MRDKVRLEAQRRETRLLEAIQSPKWDTKVVAEHNLAWLKHHTQQHQHQKCDTLLVPESMDLREFAGTTLHRMVLDGQFAATVCRMLDTWKAWADNGGMRKADVSSLQEDQVAFAQASVLLAIIKDTSSALDGTLSMDLQECLRMWRHVRLG